MKQTKLTLAALAIAIVLCAPAMAQSGKSNKKTALKEHSCNPICNEKTHQYIHGEKGHKCNDVCKENEKTKESAEKTK